MSNFTDNLVRVVGVLGTGFLAYKASEAHQKALADPANEVSYNSATVNYGLMAALIGGLTIMSWKNPWSPLLK